VGLISTVGFGQGSLNREPEEGVIFAHGGRTTTAASTTKFVF